MNSVHALQRTVAEAVLTLAQAVVIQTSQVRVFAQCVANASDDPAETVALAVGVLLERYVFPPSTSRRDIEPCAIMSCVLSVCM